MRGYIERLYHYKSRNSTKTKDVFTLDASGCVKRRQRTNQIHCTSWECSHRMRCVYDKTVEA